MNKVSYIEAGEILNVPRGTLHHAIGKGTLTKILTNSQERYLIREQVELFKGKSQLSLRSLNREERKLWEQYRDEIVNPHQVSIDTSQLTQKPEVLKEIINSLSEDRAKELLLKVATASLVTGLFQVAHL